MTSFTTKHKFTMYELGIIRKALKKYAPHEDDELNKMTAWMLYDRLMRESSAQRSKKWK